MGIMPMFMSVIVVVIVLHVSFAGYRLFRKINLAAVIQGRASQR